MNIPHYEIFVRNNNFQSISVIKAFSNLTFTTKFNDAGSFSIEMPNDNSDPVRKMKEVFGKYGGIIVAKNGEVVFSGSIRNVEQTGEYIGGRSEQERIVFEGIDDTALLASRICMVPWFDGPGAPAQYVAPWDQGWGFHIYPTDPPLPAPPNRRTVSQCLYNIVADNIGYIAPYGTGIFQDREVRPLWVKPVERMGPNYRVRLRYQNLLETCQKIANYIPHEGSDYMRNNPNYRGLGFHIYQLQIPIVTNANTNQQMNISPDTTPLPANARIRNAVFEVFRPRNLVDRIVFSRGYKNIGAFKYRVEAPKATFMVIGGMNDVANRPTTRWFNHLGRDSHTTKYGLWEEFLDRRDIQYTDPNPQRPPEPIPPPAGATLTAPQRQYAKQWRDHVQAMEEELQEQGELIEFEIDTVNTEPTRWPEDFRLGDLVTVVPPSDPDLTFATQVREVTVRLTKEEGETVTVKLGTENIRSGMKMYDQLSRNVRKTNHLGKSF